MGLPSDGCTPWWRLRLKVHIFLKHWFKKTHKFSITVHRFGKGSSVLKKSLWMLNKHGFWKSSMILKKNHGFRNNFMDSKMSTRFVKRFANFKNKLKKVSHIRYFFMDYIKRKKKKSRIRYFFTDYLKKKKVSRIRYFLAV